MQIANRLYGYLYRAGMKIAHRWHWHYAPPKYPVIGFPQGDTMLWCQWCGFRQIVRRQPSAARIRGSVAGSFAAMALAETIDKGGNVEIPSLGITLTKKDR